MSQANRAAGLRATLATPLESGRIYTFLRNAFLLLILLGYVFYPFDLWVLGHWMDSWQSRIPFLVAIPSMLATVAMLFWPRAPFVRQLFITLMVLNLVTGLAGAIFHFFYNFEGELVWTFEGIKEAFAGSRPVLAAAAFAHIGFTGLLCSLLPTPQPTTEGTLESPVSPQAQGRA